MPPLCMRHHSHPHIDSLKVSVYEIPTQSPESDGTLAWTKTTLVLVQASAAGNEGLGYTFANEATGLLIRDTLEKEVIGRDAMATNECWLAMVRAIRNLGRPGIASMAISAVDMALWDLKGRLLGLSVTELIGATRTQIKAYGSGGFTSYSNDELQKQLAGWARAGLTAAKIKIGRKPSADIERVRLAREALGSGPELFVDANGAYSTKQALSFAERFALYGVTWFEEPVSSDDLDGLRLIRAHAPPAIRITAGEYGYDLPYFERMLRAEAVDVLQADATRCGGVTGFLGASALCQAKCIPLSAHTAPTLHAHLCSACIPAINVEYFFDHYRIEQMFFDGALAPLHGYLRPNFSQPGFGLTLQRKELSRFAA